MKVIITSTPDVNSTLMNEVLSILDGQRGELEFVGIEPIPFSKITTQIEGYEACQKIDEIKILTFDELFSICRIPRFSHEVSSNDFVILITNIENEKVKNTLDESEKEWFSAFKGKNIFVKATNWEKLTDKSAHYAVAFQIVENIFQSLLGLNIDDWRTDPNVHLKPIGCVNDMCDDETEVIYKLRTAFICNDCFRRAKKQKVSDKILVQIFLLLQDIRNEYINYEDISSILKPYVVTITDKKIVIGDKELKLGKISETLFRFFLNHLEGVESIADNVKFKEELFEIYYLVKKGQFYKRKRDKETDDYKKYRDTIDLLCEGNYIISTFSKVKSDLKRELKEQLGVQFYRFYTIEDYGENGYSNETTASKNHFYKINISPDYIINNNPL